MRTTTMERPDLTTLTLLSGSHARRAQGVCAMEAVAWLAGEPHSDAPACTALPLRKFVIGTNDWMTGEERRLLLPWRWCANANAARSSNYWLVR